MSVETASAPSARTVASIPGPRGTPLLGNILSLHNDRLKFLMDVGLHYGSVAKFRIVNQKLLLISSPDGIQHILQDNNKNYRKGFDNVPTMMTMMGLGLLTNDGDSWFKQRRLMQPVFHQHNIESFATLMTGQTQLMLDNWETACETGAALDMWTEMLKLTLSVVSHALFGSDVSDRAQVLSRSSRILNEDLVMRFDFPFYPSTRVPTPHNRAILRAVKELDAVIYGIIDGRRQHPQQGDDLLNLLLNAQDPETGQKMNDTQLRDEVVTLLFAGHETVAAALTWAWYLLAQHHDVEQKLHAELGHVLEGRTPTMADVPNLKYTQMVLDETMRLYPPAWVLERRAVADDEIDGYRIPAGMHLIISPYLMHHHPAYWDDPERFDPERFSPERANPQRPHFAYFPFSAGQRQCIGKGFALVEAPLLLAMIAQHYRLLLGPDQRVAMQPVMQLRPRYGMRMTLQAR